MVASPQEDDKVSFVVRVSPDLVAKAFNASAFARNLAKRINGSAGGRADFAQGGGKGHGALAEALRDLPGLLNDAT